KVRSLPPMLVLIRSTSPKRAPSTTPAAASASSAPSARSLSAPRNSTPYSVAAAAQARAASGDRAFGAAIISSNPLARFLCDQAGRPPRHDGDDDGEREHVFVGAGERQCDSADGLQAGEQETAEDSAVDVAEAADHGRAETEDPQQK